MGKIADYEILRSCIFGHAVGDALGVPVQFMKREDLDKNPITDMLSGSSDFGMPEGSWSDDTSMTLCALDALSDKEFSWDLVMRNFEQWLNKGEYTPNGVAFGVGRTCMTAVSNYARHGDYTKCGLTTARDNGNGSLMRIIPFALYDTDDSDQLIETASALTHAHPRAKLACQIYSWILNNIIFTKTKRSLYNALDMSRTLYKDNPEWEHFKQLYEIENRSRDSIKSSVYVVDTLEAAVWCLMTTSSYKDCVLKAVNLGGDTDTVAAVAGGLAGALYGYDSIPNAWIDKLQRKDFIDELCIKAST